MWFSLLVLGGCANDARLGPAGGSPEVDTTYYADVQPIVARHCARCHDGRGIGPSNLMDPSTAQLYAELALARVDAGEMPPPAADPDCHPYVGGDWMRLPDEAHQTLARWVEQGAPLGDPAEGGVPPVLRPTALSRHDIELVTRGAYTPQFVDDNEYRCFLLADLQEETNVAGFDFLIDHREISHHALFYVDPTRGNEARITDPASASWRCPQIVPDPDWALVHAWAPSGGALEFADGQGLKLAAGSQLVLQMHYFDGGARPTPADQPAYALKLVDEIETELFFVGLGPTDFVIPAGDPAFTATATYPMSWITGFGLLQYRVWGVLPHMHGLGAGYDFRASGPTGDACISRADAYDFDMQPTYWFEEPVPVRADDTLIVSCTWDNSADNPDQLFDPPRDVRFGENTQEEMCYALMYVEGAAGWK